MTSFVFDAEYENRLSELTSGYDVHM